MERLRVKSVEARLISVGSRGVRHVHIARPTGDTRFGFTLESGSLNGVKREWRRVVARPRGLSVGRARDAACCLRRVVTLSVETRALHARDELDGEAPFGPAGLDDQHRP